MRKLRQSGLAKADIVQIWLHIAANDEAVANRVIDGIFNKISQLAIHPEIGPVRPDIAADARSLRADRWLILYRILPEAVEVVRVVDGARDLSKLEL